MRVLLVTNQASESAYLHKALRECAHSVHLIEGLADGFHVASEEHFDTVIVMCDYPVAYHALIALLPQLAKLRPVPEAIIILGKGNAADRTRLLRAGADACFVQPYAFAELQERMQAMLRRRQQSETQALRQGAHAIDAPRHAATVGSAASSASYAGPSSISPASALRAPACNVPPPVLDEETHRLMEGSRAIALTAGEFLFVKCLMRSVDRPVSREHLISYAWPDSDEVEAATVALVASRLRRKMRQANFRACVETVPRFGYRLRLGADTSI